MSTALALDPAAVDAGDRGAVTVADRVVEKTAAHAVTEVADTLELPRRVSDRLPGRHAPHARADALVSGRLVQLRVEIAVRYPAPVVEVTRAVRTHVRSVVGRLCDVEVRDVDVVVVSLRRPEKPPRVR